MSIATLLWSKTNETLWDRLLLQKINASLYFILYMTCLVRRVFWAVHVCYFSPTTIHDISVFIPNSHNEAQQRSRRLVPCCQETVHTSSWSSDSLGLLKHSVAMLFSKIAPCILKVLQASPVSATVSLWTGRGTSTIDAKFNQCLFLGQIVSPLSFTLKLLFANNKHKKTYKRKPQY